MSSSDLMRLSGLNTGYDTESMIESMLSSYQTRIDNQSKKLTKLQWQQEAYRDVTTKLTDFKNKYFDILKRDSYLMSPTSFIDFKSTISAKNADGKDAKGLSAITTSKSIEGSYKLKVDRLATATKASGKTLNPNSFSLDLDKAANASSYTTEKNSDGKNERKYNFELDVQVGNVTKTIAFDVSAIEGDDGKIDIGKFNEDLLNAMNKELQEEFGRTDGDSSDYFLQGKIEDGKVKFDVGGNAAVSVTEKTGNFGMAEPAEHISIAAQSAVTGKNSVAVSIGGVTKNVEFDGVSSTYYDSRNQAGNEAILKEFNELKLAAYRRQDGVSAFANPTQEELDRFSYTSVDAAKDKNGDAIESALNKAFKDENAQFFYVDGTMSAVKDGKTAEFSMTATSGGTLGLTKGTSSNKYSGKTKLEDMGITGNGDDGSYTFKINDKEIKLNKGATIDSMIEAVKKSGAGVTMTYSALTNSFEITANDMGSAGNIVIEGNDITKALGLTDEDGTIGYTKGQNAIININGQQIYHNSNDFTFDGTTFKFDDDIELGTDYNVTLSKNYDDIKKTIKDFVKDYNQLIDDVYKHIGTAPKRDKNDDRYEPLTDAEKEDMDEDEIEKWEEAAKQGVIYNDSTVSGIMSRIRTAMYNGVKLDDGSTFGLYKMGIKASTEYEDHGKLEIDEEAFDKAFEENADAISKLFTDPDKGIMKQINTALDNAVRSTGKVKGTLINKAGLETGSTAKDNYIYRQMKSVNDRISQLQKRYDAKEEYWWDVFTNLEKMMADMNSQQSYLSSYLGGGGTY